MLKVILKGIKIATIWDRNKFRRIICTKSKSKLFFYKCANSNKFIRWFAIKLINKPVISENSKIDIMMQSFTERIQHIQAVFEFPACIQLFKLSVYSTCVLFNGYSQDFQFFRPSFLLQRLKCFSLVQTVVIFLQRRQYINLHPPFAYQRELCHGSPY